MYYDAKELKQIVKDHNLTSAILIELGIPREMVDEALNNRKGHSREHPCPHCGGDTRFSIVDINEGWIYCSHKCNRAGGDIIGAIMFMRECSFHAACQWLWRYLY